MFFSANKRDTQAVKVALMDTKVESGDEATASYTNPRPTYDKPRPPQKGDVAPRHARAHDLPTEHKTLRGVGTRTAAWRCFL